MTTTPIGPIAPNERAFATNAAPAQPSITAHQQQGRIDSAELVQRRSVLPPQEVPQAPSGVVINAQHIRADRADDVFADKAASRKAVTHAHVHHAHVSADRKDDAAALQTTLWAQILSQAAARPSGLPGKQRSALDHLDITKGAIQAFMQLRPIAVI